MGDDYGGSSMQIPRKKIDKLSIDAPNDPTLNYYQTEIWYSKGEQEYSAGNFKKALGYYEKAYQYWSANPLLVERIKDVKEKLKNPKRSNLENSKTSLDEINNISDEQVSTSVSINSRAIDSLSLKNRNVNLIILDKELQEQIREQFSKINDVNKEKELIVIPKSYLILFLILGGSLVTANLVGLYILIRKSE
ncbi:MAG TPA: hypothetical protein PLP33_29855 [Leptospiraceae bacterium]|nr:hypothetical protein [Leptospiraceae bacterium]HMY32764.1 hypothetical protein [Leptospiraceae bacterium]HMZ67205.1 hypothetical protein [Leptospiraceae bacterium]HNA05804.1 hypothetical protein [Leptospiraceae bacterium]HNC00963.1 hypothetical protein [Leptospiraceae bacterium]